MFQSCKEHHAVTESFESTVDIINLEWKDHWKSAMNPTSFIWEYQSNN